MRRVSQSTRLVALVATFALVISTPASAKISQREKELGSLGTAAGNNERSAGLNLIVQKAEKNESENLISITWAIENTGTEGVSITWLHEGSYQYHGPFFSAVRISDSDRGRRFHPVMDGNGGCLCSGNTSRSFLRRVEPGKEVSYWSLYSIPNDIESISLEAPGFEPVEAIPIS